MACLPDTNANSNDAVGKNNNARALWEFIDTDTSGANGGTDSNAITLTQLMDGLHYFKQQIGGTPGINRKANEPIFNPEGIDCAPPLPLNENCDPGEACIQTDSGYECYSGDPHGANIADFANVLNAYYGSGLGSFTLTLSSSDCLGSDDDGHPFVGGYRWD